MIQSAVHVFVTKKEKLHQKLSFSVLTASPHAADVGDNAGVNFNNILRAAFFLQKRLMQLLCAYSSGWQFAKLLGQICKIFCNFKVLLWSSYS